MAEKEQPDLGYFHDGKGPLSKDTPDEFASDWQYRNHLAALEREVAGAEAKVAELKGMVDVPAATQAGAESALKAAKHELARYEKPKAKAKK